MRMNYQGIGGFSVHNDSDSTDDRLTTRGHKKVRESAKVSIPKYTILELVCV